MTLLLGQHPHVVDRPRQIQNSLTLWVACAGNKQTSVCPLALDFHLVSATAAAGGEASVFEGVDFRLYYWLDLDWATGFGRVWELSLQELLPEPSDILIRFAQKLDSLPENLFVGTKSLECASTYFVQSILKRDSVRG